jgi:ribosomal protein S6
VKGKMKTYEITYLTVNEETNDAKTVAPALANHGAKIVSVHPWGARRRLIHPIKKETQASYTTVVFEAEPSAVLPIEADLRLNNDVLRSIVVVFEPGVFHRSTPIEEAPVARGAEVKEEKVTAEVAQSPEISEVAPTQPALDEKPTEDKPKRKRVTKKATQEDEKALDEKLEALLKEDITA